MGKDARPVLLSEIQTISPGEASTESSTNTFSCESPVCEAEGRVRVCGNATQNPRDWREARKTIWVWKEQGPRRMRPPRSGPSRSATARHTPRGAAAMGHPEPPPPRPRAAAGSVQATPEPRQLAGQCGWAPSPISQQLLVLNSRNNLK